MNRLISCYALLIIFSLSIPIYLFLTGSEKTGIIWTADNTIQISLQTFNNTQPHLDQTETTSRSYSEQDFHTYPYNLPLSFADGTLLEITSFVQIKAAASIASSETCEKCVDEDCKEECSSLQLVSDKLEADSSEGRVRLFVVPVDSLSWTESSEKTIQSFVDNLKSSFEYRRFKGSDHVFLCLHDGCTQLGKELGEALANKKGTRAMFAGRNLNESELAWPCPLRVINLQNRSTNILDDLDKILKISTLMIEKRNRWVCANEFHHPNHWDLDDRVRTGIVNKEYGVSLCSIPKSGSTMIKMLLRRMEGYENWKQEGKIVWDQRFNGLKYFRSMNADRKEELKYDLSFVTGTVVRDPVSRLLSGYLDKIRDKKEYFRVKGLTEYVRKTRHNPPSFPEFVGYLMKVVKNPDYAEEHFVRQSSRCSHRGMEYDFFTHQRFIYEDFKEFAESLGFWEEYGANGWGKGSTTDGAFGEKSIDHKTHNSGGLIWQYYTEPLVMKVYNYYKEDFDRFGFSIEEILATNPAKQNTTVRL